MQQSLLSDESSVNQVAVKQQPISKQKKALSIASSSSSKNKHFPTRAFLSVLMILLTTVQVLLLINSHFYLHSGLVRSFLNLYVDEGLYPELFSGNQYYIYLYNLTEFQDSINYVMQTIQQSENETLFNMNFTEANIYLYVQYHYSEFIKNRPNQIKIDPLQGIVEPFNSKNLSSIKQFLLQIKFFEIRIENLTLQTSGLYESYDHRLIYRLVKGNKLVVNFDFMISNALASSIEVERPQTLKLLYLKLFYFGVFFISLANFYVNTQYINRTLKDFFSTLRKKQNKKENHIHSDSSINSQTDKQQIQEIHENIKVNIEVRNITQSNKKWQDYVAILDSQVLFGMLASILMMVGNAYLFFGSQHQNIIGLGCLLSWITIFGIIKTNKKLVLMYELIKMSMVRVLEFLFSFFILFMGYSLMGLCWFPKVIFFSEMSYSVTTLISLMAGDSVSMITTAMQQKYSSVLSIFYIFSYIILFMHAIHNTLTAIIKEYFLIQKIETIKRQKQQKKQQNYVYLHEVPRESQLFLREHRVKLDDKLTLELQKIRVLIPVKRYNRMVRLVLRRLQHHLSEEKWQIFDQNLHHHFFYQRILKQRLRFVLELLKKWKNMDEEQRINKESSFNNVIL